MAKLTEDNIREIRSLAAHGCKHKDIARGFGVSRANVSYIVKRIAWKHIE